MIYRWWTGISAAQHIVRQGLVAERLGGLFFAWHLCAVVGCAAACMSLPSR